MAEGDWEGWKILTDLIGKPLRQLAGRLTCSLPTLSILKWVSSLGCANSILV